jgi:hypothetical protein
MQCNAMHMVVFMVHRLFAVNRIEISRFLWLSKLFLLLSTSTFKLFSHDLSSRNANFRLHILR